MTGTVKRVLRRARRVVHATIVCLTAAAATMRAFVAGRRRSEYDFSLRDALNHFVERVRAMPDLEQVGTDPFPLYEVRGRRFAWPSELPTSGLPWLFTEVFAPPRWNPSSYAHPDARLVERPWVLDAGAGEGFFTMWALERGARRVVAIEPLDLLQGPLEATFADEVAAGRVEVLRAALGVRSGETTIDLALDRPSEATVGAGTEVVPVRSLDDLASQLSLPPGGFIKMDIEGAEMDALTGGSRVLRDLRPALAVAVYHDLDNARACREIVVAANPSYRTALRGMNAYMYPPRPYMLLAW